MERAELLTRLRGIEGTDFEVKAAAGGVPDDAYKSVSAFANTLGGWLVFGVSERRGTFAITGVADPDRMQNDFVSACRSAEKFSRPVDVMPRIFAVDDAIVICFRVPAASRSDKPVRVRSRKIWETYIRVGAGDHLCSLEEESRFLRDASLDSFDGLACADVTMEDLSPRAIKWFRGVLAQRRPERAHPDLDDAAWLAETGLTRGKGELTNAAVLLFGRDRAIVRVKPAGILDFRVIDDAWAEGTPEHRWDDRELFEDNLVGTLRGAFERMARRLPTPFAFDGDEGRSAARSPDFVAVREALVNLVAHQDYADRNRTARVLWYRDRVLFENPGDSFVPLAQMLDGGVSQLRNPLLARLLRQAGLAEQAGTGTMAIVRAWRAARRAPPEIVNDAGRKQFTLTLPWTTFADHELARWLRLRGLSASDDAGRVLAVARGGTLTWVTARLATGLAASTLAGLIAKLVAANHLVPADDSADERWIVGDGTGAPVTVSKNEPVSSKPEPVGDDHRPGAAEQDATLLAVILATPGLRAPALVLASGWSIATVKRVLARLRASGAVVYDGAPKNGGYRATEVSDG